MTRWKVRRMKGETMEMSMEKALERKVASRRSFDAKAASFDRARVGRHSRELYRHVLWELAGVYQEWLCRERREGRVDELGAPERSFRVLDLGCGTGALAQLVNNALPCARVTGVDISGAMVDRARERLGGSVRLFRADAESLPFAEGSFDAVIMNDVLHHVPDASRAAFEAWRVLGRDGVLVMGDHWAPTPVRVAMNLLMPLSSAGDVCVRSSDELKELFGGWFQVVEWRRAGMGACLVRARKSKLDLR